MKGFTWVQFPFDAITDIDRLECLPMSILVRMAKMMNRNGYLRMTYKVMAKQLPLSKSNYYRAIESLIESHLIERKGQSAYKVTGFYYGKPKELAPVEFTDLSTGRKYQKRPSQ